MLSNLLENNKQWADQKAASDAAYFGRLSEGQAPEYLWIGCADSRVPAESILGLQPGELFVHRNVANQVQVDDDNAMSVLQYAVAVLKVKHIIVCGHSGCGGVKAAYTDQTFGHLTPWLSNLKSLAQQEAPKLSACGSEDESLAMLTEMNVQHQVDTLANHETIKEAWANGQELSIHGWVFELDKGLLKNLEVSVSGS